MIITCPACSARFNVADHMIGTTGRVVRCAKCGHKWHQMPEGMEGMAPPPPPPPPPPPSPRPTPQAAAAQAAAQPQPPKGTRPSPLPKLGDIPLEMPARGGGAPAPASGGFEEEGGGSQDDIDLAAALDRVAGVVAEADAQQAFQSASAKPSNEETAAGQAAEDEFDFEETEPIPAVFTKDGGAQARTASAKGKSTGILVVLLMLVVLLGGLAAGGYMLREKVVEIFPQATALYDMLGIQAEALGTGLKFRNVTSDRMLENNVELLVVHGDVANISDVPRDLPLIKLSLYDSANLVVQEKVMPPPERSLGPGEVTGFKISIESPAAAAKRFEITFAARPGQE